MKRDMKVCTEQFEEAEAALKDCMRCLGEAAWADYKQEPLVEGLLNDLEPILKKIRSYYYY